MLKIENVISGYGAIQVLWGMSMSLDDGDITAIIGANGAGKSTLLRTISGLVPARQGKIIFDNKDITRVPPHKIFSMGMAHIPEGRQLFSSFSVYENLLVGCYPKHRSLGKSGIKAQVDRVFDLFPILSERKDQVAGTLSGGEQQMLAIARALMSQPKLLLLDEPSQGLAPLVVQSISNILLELNKNEGLSILLVEQNTIVALNTARYIYVLERGTVALHGKTEEVKNDPKVKETYLGEVGIKE